MNVTAHIDTSTPKGRKILRDLERSKKIVVIENPMPIGDDGLPLKTVSLEDSFDKLWVKMEKHSGFDLRKL